MSILQDVLAWAEGLPAWQSDAIRRLVAGPLSPQDLDDLLALLKAEHGIADPRGRTAMRLSADRIPAASPGGAHVELVAIRDLRHVNAIAENQRLPFAAKGLTVIYGDNGSGKSGYSRVLKRACRARDQSEPIYPNANRPQEDVGTAEAIFEVAIDGTRTDVRWVNGEPSPEVLSSLAIFDTRCARAYLDSEDDFAYVPYGLDVLEGLASACKQLEGLIKDEISRNAPDTAAFAHLRGFANPVGQLISCLSAKTGSAEIEALTSMSDEEIARCTELTRHLSADDPMEKAQQLRHTSNRIGRLARNVQEKLAIVDAAALTKLRGLAGAYNDARAAAELAARGFADPTLLPGTGGEAWKALFEAARKFSLEAHAGKDLVDLDVGSQCPLCQQALGEGAQRLAHFDRFLRDEAETTARARKQEFENAARACFSQSVAIGLDDDLLAEIEAVDRALAARVRAFEANLCERQAAIKAACDSGAWDQVPAEPASPEAQLQTVSDRLAREAVSLEQACEESARAAMERELDELHARLELAKVEAAVVAAVGKMQTRARLTECLGALKTNAISSKSRELADKAISRELAEALNREFKALGVDHLHVQLHSRIAKGKPLHKLKLESALAKGLGETLSEGEQRAIAIGAFLAEVAIGGKTGGIVFDDPVSSMDHRRRERVAVRLAQEAAKRQVIVFTHDLYFLSVLIEAAERAEAACEAQSLSKRPEGYGIPDPRLPFEAMNTKARVGELRNLQLEVAKAYKEGDEVEHRRQTTHAYRQLRIAWERAVEEVLLRKVVQRFSKGVSTQLLAGVQVDDEDYRCVEQAMAKCSNYAHDQAVLGGTEMPTPAELLDDINALETWRSKVDKRGTELAKRRKAGALAAA